MMGIYLNITLEKKPKFWRRIKPGELGLIGIKLPQKILQNCSETEVKIDTTKIAQKGKDVYLNDKRLIATFEVDQDWCEKLPLRLQRKNLSVKRI